ncbi:MAG TPA: hypothetical protein VFX22_10475 [Candidatus Kapabacteria bacterium]|nr:hypothetical protein [Candidatus Kapabacteria bacterium]
MEYLDDQGDVSGSDETDADYKAALGLVVERNGRNVYPVFTFDSIGRKTNDGAAIGYGGILDSEVIGFNEFDADNAATILPKVLSVGMSWTPAPEALPVQCRATLVQHLNQYSNKGGTTYNDVIQVHVTYLDSISSQSNKFSANVDLYFANAVGLVEADVHSFDVLYGDPYDFKHSVGSGTVYRKN